MSDYTCCLSYGYHYAPISVFSQSGGKRATTREFSFQIFLSLVFIIWKANAPEIASRCIWNSFILSKFPPKSVPLELPACPNPLGQNIVDRCISIVFLAGWWSKLAAGRSQCFIIGQYYDSYRRLSPHTWLQQQGVTVQHLDAQMEHDEYRQCHHTACR